MLGPLGAELTKWKTWSS